MPCGLELPPRTRRILQATGSGFMLRGTTSAHAENTTPWSEGVFELGNYLRVRGEYFNIIDDTEAGKELPPRARRILQHH